jgi:hypothetical protein
VIVATNSPHAESENSTRGATPSQELDQVEEAMSVLSHEMRLLDAMMAVPTADLETIWCRLYDEFEGTSTAQKIRAAQGRTRAVQESVTRAVASALMPLRRRLFDADALETSAAPSAISTVNSTSLGSAAPVVGLGQGGVSKSHSLTPAGKPQSTTSRRKGATTFVGEEEPTTSLLDSTSLGGLMRHETSIVLETTTTDSLTSSTQSGTGATAAAPPATAALRRRRAGSVIAAHVLPTARGATASSSDDRGADDGESGGVASVLLLANGTLAASFQHALADMEAYLGAVTALLDTALEPLRHLHQPLHEPEDENSVS